MVVYVLSDSEKLTQRVKDELGITKYKPVQYDKLQAMVEAKKMYSEKIEQKVRRDNIVILLFFWMPMCTILENMELCLSL